METKELTLSEYVESLGITSKATPIAVNGHEWAKQGWKVTLYFQGRRMSFNFYGGGAVSTPDTSAGVWCMALESSGVEDRTFSEWALEFGYSDDSRRAFRDFNKIKANASKFSDFIGSDEILSKLQELAINY